MSGAVRYTAEDLLDHHAVAAVIRDSLSRVLIVEHKKWGFWSIPIGKAHPGQDPLAGLKEEMREELGIEIEQARDVVQCVLKYDREGRTIRLVMHIFEVDAFGGTIENLEPTKHARLEYMYVEEIAALDCLSDATLLYLEELGANPRASWQGRPEAYN